MSRTMLAHSNGVLEVVELLSRHPDHIKVQTLHTKKGTKARKIFFSNEKVREVKDTNEGEAWIIEQRRKQGLPCPGDD